jgi:D-hexose-6-phosphate mutarotase
MFEELNFRYFFGLMARPSLGWSRQDARTMLGHYDSSHNAIVLSRLLDRPETPRLAVEYVLFHEMLHLRHPVEHQGSQAVRSYARLQGRRKAVRALARSQSDAPQTAVRAP